MVPTRELVQQIAIEAKKLAPVVSARVLGIFGGVGKGAGPLSRCLVKTVQGVRMEFEDSCEVHLQLFGGMMILLKDLTCKESSWCLEKNEKNTSSAPGFRASLRTASQDHRCQL